VVAVVVAVAVTVAGESAAVLRRIKLTYFEWIVLRAVPGLNVAEYGL